jgi:hypothetical protein
MKRRLQLNSSIRVNGLHSNFSDDELGRHFIDVEITRMVPLKLMVPGHPSSVTVNVNNIEVSEKDIERLARAVDALHYATEFLSGEEICSYQSHKVEKEAG